MRLLTVALAAAALACASPLAAQAVSTPTIVTLPLTGADGAVHQEAGVFDGGGRFYPAHSLFGWTGAVLRSVTVDGPTGDLRIICDSGCSGGGGSGGSGGAVTQSGPWTVNLGALNGASTAAGQATEAGYLSSIAGAAAGLALHTDAQAIIAALGTPLQAGGGVTVTNLPATQPISAAALPLPAGAATSARQDALLAAVGSPLQAGGAVTVTGGPTATGQTAANTSLAAILVALQATLATKSAPYTTATPLTPGTPVGAGRALFLACTAAGSVRVKLSTGNTLDVPVYVGPNELAPYAVTDIVAANTTATCVATVLN